MRAEAFAKVNLGLQVRPPAADGYHPIRSLALSVDWADSLEIEASPQDGFVVRGASPSGDDNLAMLALRAVRAESGAAGPVTLRLEKRIATAAGLGGGSADAAAALVLADAHYRTGLDLSRLGAAIGADVPFCLDGGLAYMEGRGERVTSAGAVPADCTLAIVVPPFELATGEVYAAWDRLGGPDGPAPDLRALPPSLRSHAPLPNDLYPAAVQLAPGLDDWRAELATRWERPVAMTGSGPSLFAYFLDRDEAEAALRDLPPGARAAEAVAAVVRGVSLTGGTLS